MKKPRFYGDMTVEIKRERKWSPDSVREMCIKHRFYTCGDSNSYENLLYNIVFYNDPTPKAIYKAAKDILDHSDPEITGDSVTNIMFWIEKEAVDTFYEVEDIA